MPPGSTNVAMPRPKSRAPAVSATGGRLGELLKQQVKAGLVVAALVGEASGRGVREGVGRDEVAAAQLGRVEARLPREQVHQPLGEVGGLRAAGAAVRADRGGVREDAGQFDVEVLDAVALREHRAEAAEQ